MKRQPDFIVLAQRYVDYAQVHIRCGERALDANDRAYHVATAREYLLLADSELRAARSGAAMFGKRPIRRAPGASGRSAYADGP
jgi:hypothetical protein